MPQSPNTTTEPPRQVVLVRATRQALARLNPDRRDALNQGFLRVGRELLASADRATVAPAWARHTWPRRGYPQQCYSRTARYVLDHADIGALRLVHGVASHAPYFVPFDHAWVLLPGDVVFDGVVQAFFTHASYVSVMRAVALDSYSADDALRLSTLHGHPGPWNASWIPTVAQLEAYAAAVTPRERDQATPSLSDDVGTNR